MRRRKFILNTALTPFIAGSFINFNNDFNPTRSFNSLKIGICADVHQDFIPDGPERLSAFIDYMTVEEPDFIIQLGDFCQPDNRNQFFMDVWNRFPGPKYHVIGNHDPEGDYTQDDVVKFWEAEGKYYSFDHKEYHFVVLNGNEQNPTHEKPWKYERYISDVQLDWLAKDLKKTNFPTIVFCHQGIDIDGIENNVQVRRAFELANEEAGFRKVQVVFSGHHHQDYLNIYNGIQYVQINSMSYHWQGNRSSGSPYNKKIEEEYPLIKYMAHYKDPLWAVVEIFPEGLMKIDGVESTFLGTPPKEQGNFNDEFIYPVVPKISNRELKITKEPF